MLPQADGLQAGLRVWSQHARIPDLERQELAGGFDKRLRHFVNVKPNVKKPLGRVYAV